MFASSSKFLAFLALVLVTETVVAGPAVVPARAGLHSKFARRALKRKRVDDAQTSLQLDPSQIGPNLALTGQEVPAAGQVPSLTSTNNYINFCLTQNTVLTDGKQTKTGSCCQTPMGRIIASDRIPVSKFTFPVNGGAIKANTSFTIKMTVVNLNAGHFTNPTTTYYNAPQTVDSNGLGIGHSHVVAEAISAFDTQDLPDPRNFAFFKGLNAAQDANGQLTADVTGGLPVGFYKLSSINTAANHQPFLFAVAQHGTSDEAIYFEVTEDGKPSAANIAANPPKTSATVDTNASASVSASASSTTASAAASVSASASSVASASASAASSAATTTTAASASSTTTSVSGNRGKGGKNGKNNATTPASATDSVAASSVAASTTTTATADKGNKGKNGKNDKAATSAASSTTTSAATTSAVASTAVSITTSAPVSSSAVTLTASEARTTSVV